MRSAALCCGALFAVACALVSCVHAAGAPGHELPTRPGVALTSHPRPLPPVATVRVAGIECVSVPHIASELGLRVLTRNNGRRVVLEGTDARAELEADTRDISVNGLRVFLGTPVIPARGQLYVSRIDFERCLKPLLRPGLGVVVPTVPKVIVIDAGHGGKDFGKINAQLGINEKTMTLDTARRLKVLLEADGYRVVLTRNDDRFIELGERAAIANNAHADLFISIHYNAIDGDHRTSGVEVYTFAPQYQRSTESWMPGKREDSQATPEPANEFDGWNLLLAESLHRPFLTELKMSDRGRKIMHLGVLRSLHCPGTLVECGFLTSDAEARKIETPAYREQIARALRDGVRGYTRLIVSLRQRAGSPQT